MGKKFRGIGCPCLTPFNADESLDLIHLRELVDFQINNEIHAIMPASSCGESYALRDEEYREIIDAVIDQVNEAIPVYMGLPSESTLRSVDVARYSTDAGADGLVISPPRISSLSEGELLYHFEYISSKIDNNILVVNDPDQSGIDLSVDTITNISKASNNIVGIIERSSDFNKLTQITAAVDDDFYVFAGRGLLVPQAINKGGADGAIVPSANIVPNLLVELYEAHKVEMKERFEEIQAKMIPLEIGLKLGTFPAAIKACLNLLGIQVGVPRMPVSPLPEKDIEKLRKILIEAGCLPPPVEPSDDRESSEETGGKNNKSEGGAGSGS